MADLLLGLEGLDRLIDALGGAGWRVLGPRVRAGAIVYDEVRRTRDLPLGVGDEQSPGTYRLRDRGDAAVFGYAVGPESLKRHLLPPDEVVVRVRGRTDPAVEVVEVPERPTAVIGVRACDLVGSSVLDHVVGRGPHASPRSTARRDELFIVAVACSSPAATCFCASVGTGPRPVGGYDVLLTEILGPPHRFVAESATERGSEVVRGLEFEPASDADLTQAAAVVTDAAEAQVRHLDPAAREIAAHPEADAWLRVAERCLACGNCTQVCPTCFCTDVVDVTGLDPDLSERKVVWDSCFSGSHSYVHGGPVRSTTATRYRQWLVHKVGTWWDQFGESGCVGCGRCITWCPVGIDLTAETPAVLAGGAGG